MHSVAKKFKVAICGGGIGGLTLAIALSRYPDIEVEIFEAANSLAEIGAGVGIFPRPWRVMQLLGLDQELLKHTEAKCTNGPTPAFQYRKSDQRQGFDFYRLVTNGSLLTFHRADFQSVLLRYLPKTCPVHCRKRLVSYTQHHSSPIELYFEDGTLARCDILVGADGIKSAVRKSLLQEKAVWARNEGRIQEASEVLSGIEPSWTGQIAYRAVIPGEKIRARWPGHRVLTTPMQYLGKGGFVIAYPIQHGRMINFVAFVFRHDLENTKFNGPWVGPSDKSQFAPVFEHWEPEVKALIDCTEKPLRWAVHTVNPLRSFVSGRVALLGDAAHAMNPHQGSGAGQALEDAIVIATVLGHRRTTRETAYRALQIFDEIRRPLALRVHEKCRMNGKCFTFELDGLNLERSNGKELWDKLQYTAKAFTKNWEWAWTTSIDTMLQQAVHMLES